MDMNIFHIEANKLKPTQGRLLISSPLMLDNFFSRSVVIIIDNNKAGAMGLTLNKSFNHNIMLNDLFPVVKTNHKIPLYSGGPVGRETIFFLHNIDKIKGSLSLGNNIYLNGNFEEIVQYINTTDSLESHIRFFLGYSAWDQNMLSQEIKGNQWIVSNTKTINIIQTHHSELWKKSLERLGGKYKLWSKYPLYPSLN